MSVTDFKNRIGIAESTQDAAILSALKSASRQIDNWCGRQFNQGPAGEVRYFTAQYVSLELDDFIAVTEIALDSGSGTYTRVMDSDTYLLSPVGSLIRGEPYTMIQPRPIGFYVFPRLENAVRVTGTFGWPAVPEPVAEACFLMANRLKSLWTAPFGETGSGEMGQLISATSLTPVIKEMLSAYRVLTV